MDDKFIKDNSLTAGKGESEEISWITSNGAHIPIHEGQTEKEACEKHFEKTRLIDNNNKNEYTKVSAQGRKLCDFRSLKDLLNSPNLDEMIQKSQFAFFSKGREDLIIKPIIKELGFDGLPQKVTANEFEKLKKTNKALYRGVEDSKYINDYKNGEMFIGLGVNGTGVYTTIEQQKAQRYAKDGGVIELLIDKDAKIANGFELTIEAKELLFSLKSGTDVAGNPINVGLDAEKLSKVGEGSNKRFVTLLALSKGYDAIEVGNGDFIILNRTATIVKEE